MNPKEEITCIFHVSSDSLFKWSNISAHCLMSQHFTTEVKKYFLHKKTLPPPTISNWLLRDASILSFKCTILSDLPVPDEMVYLLIFQK